MAKVWADGPYELLNTPTKEELEGISSGTAGVAISMTLAHNIMIRGLNAIYLQATNIKSEVDIQDFLHFCRAWYLTIHHHHSGEETYFFPFIAAYTGDPDIMKVNLEQHETFGDGVEKLNEYVLAATPATYDGKEIQRQIEQWAPILRTHLKEEIATLLGLEKFGGNKLKKAFADWESKVFSEMTEKELIFPLGFGANDKTFEGGVHHFPPVPFFVPYIVNFVYGRKYKGAWRFCPCDAYGKPRPLQFV